MPNDRKFVSRKVVKAKTSKQKKKKMKSRNAEDGLTDETGRGCE